MGSTMTDELLINVNEFETRAALMCGGSLLELHIARSRGYSLTGNIYLGRVQRVVPGMQAAFVDIGLERPGFLHARDMRRREAAVRGAAVREAAVREPAAREAGEETFPDIRDLAAAGQSLLVQIVKDPISSKGARLSTQVTLASRYVVLMPFSGHVGISQRIEAEEERARLTGIIEEIRNRRGIEMGFIARTAAEAVESETLEADVDRLLATWDSVLEARAQSGCPAPVYVEMPMQARIVRDLSGPEVERIVIDDERTRHRVEGFVDRHLPELAGRIEGYAGTRPLFEHYGVDDEVARALRPKVEMKCGGYLVIEQTEAMTTVDVNTGSYLGGYSLEETAYRTNLEAARALPRQLRLRNLGGIIVIDFIDMHDEEHQRHVLRVLEKACEKDTARVCVEGFSSLGLVQMSRKRTRGSLAQQVCEPCGVCRGTGVIKTDETTCIEVFRAILKDVDPHCAETRGDYVVRAPQGVVDRLIDEDAEHLARLARQIGREIRIQMEPSYGPGEFDVVLMQDGAS